ncbi:MAG: glycine reductase [Actinobacteria bacterium]|nr:glycine reductase [Actinomycetota bacterium]
MRVPLTGTPAVIKAASLFLFHTPDLVRYGSKPRREVEKDPELLGRITQRLRTFEETIAYAPNQVFVGGMAPESLWDHPEPWFRSPVDRAEEWGKDGRIVPQAEFYLLLKASDDFKLVDLDEDFMRSAWEVRDQRGPLVEDDRERIGEGSSPGDIAEAIDDGALPLYMGSDIIGCIKPAHSEDPALDAATMLENLAAKATATAALRHALSLLPEGTAGAIDYLMGCGEEAAGDRYQRGGGGLAKAVGQMAGCLEATGSDIKAFCCAPNHSIVLGSGMIASGLFRNVAVIAGGALSKLGMKHAGHLKNEMPILEDVLGSVALVLGQDDGRAPLVDLTCVGKHPIRAGASQKEILGAVVCEPLDRVGMKIVDVDRFATELHNPELTIPQGGGDVPLNNYRMLAGMAALRHEIDPSGVGDFVREHGLPGFSPTQGHIASAVPFLGHAVRGLTEGNLHTAFFYAKGSFFLGRMTSLSDGFSFLLRRNRGPALKKGG